MPKLQIRSHKTISYTHLIGIITLCCFGTVNADETAHVVQKIDKFVQSMMNCSLVPALSLSVVQDDEVIFSKGYGYTSINKTDQVTSKTKFAIGSLTKAFTSLLFAKLVKESKNIKFDTPISQFIPDFRLVDDYRSQYTTLRDLLGHRVAIPRYDTPIIMGIDPNVSRREFARKLQFLSSPYSFREKFIYNNYMYILAGDILEQLSNGRLWESHVRESIFNPLGMTNSGFVDEENALKDDFALPCDNFNGTVVDVDPRAFRIANVVGPAGTIYSTADDMAKWMMFLLKTKSKANLGIDHSMVKMTMEPSSWFDMKGVRNLYKPYFPISDLTDHYGMGWVLGSYSGFKKVYHTGGVITHSSRLWLFPEMNLGIFLSTNGPESGRSNLMNAIPYHLADIMLKQLPWFDVSDVCSSDPMPWVKVIYRAGASGGDKTQEEDFRCTSATNCNLSDYIGTYTDPTFGDVSIRFKHESNSNSSNHSNNSENSESQMLTLIYGRFGTLDLTPKSRSLFSGKFYGTNWFMNTKSDVFEVVFGIDNITSNDKLERKPARFLLMSLYGERKAGPFIRRESTSPGNNGGHTNRVFSCSFACYIFIYVLFSFMTILLD